MVNYSLYRKYRPQKFSEICGQEYISKVLKNQVKYSKFSHAYLFSGIRGTGKTSCARIFSKAINCIENDEGDPCGKCSSCLQNDNSGFLNLIELDAASNNSVEQIRNLIEELRYSNFVKGYKIYILDEVHMLSMNAFNALLKTLEEPPKNVVFILSTTEMKKIPSTISSRCQRFDFKNIEVEKIVDRLVYISDCEKINIEGVSLELIARMGKGSMRDSISILERVLFYNDDVITLDYVRKILGITPNEVIYDFLKFLHEGDDYNSIRLISNFYNQEINIKNFIVDLRNSLRDILCLKLNINDSDILIEKDKNYVSKMIEISSEFDIKAIEFMLNELNKIIESTLLSELEYRIFLELFAINFTRKMIKGDKETAAYKEEDVNYTLDRKFDSSYNLDFDWDGFLNYLKKISLVLYSLLQNGRVCKLENNKLFFKCNTQGILNRLKSYGTLKQIEEHIKSFCNLNLIFEVFVDEKRIQNDSVEDKLKKVLGDDVEIENR